MFEDRNALLVDPEDVSAIAAALRRLCEDEGLRTRLAAGSRAVDAEHDLACDVEAFASAIVRAAGEG